MNRSVRDQPRRLSIGESLSRTQVHWWQIDKSIRDGTYLGDSDDAGQGEFTSQQQEGLSPQKYLTTKLELEKRTAASIRITTQLAAFVPDYVLINEFPRITYDTTIDAVAFICDVSGFTALTEAYSLRGKGGTEQLTRTLSSYMNPLAEYILRAGGDIIKYAGDAILAIWRVTEDHFLEEVYRAIDCALYIQEVHGTFTTDVGVIIRVKIGIGAGIAYECVVGNTEYHYFVTFGPGVADASEAEHNCDKGDVIVAPSAWKYCSPSDFQFIYKEHQFVKIVAIVNFPSTNPDMRGRPSPLIKVQKVKELRPVVSKAVERKSEQQLRPYVITPVQKFIDSSQALEFLNESHFTSICFIKLELVPIEENALFADRMLQIVQKAFRYIYDTAKLTGGSLTKIIMFDKGLTYLVVFGLPGYIHINQSSNALEFCQRVKGQLGAIKNVTEVSLGVTTGSTYCGILGHPKRREYTVLGQQVNKAARLMCNYVGYVSCDHDTVVNSRKPIHYFQLLPQKALKGIASAGNIYEYLGAEAGEDLAVKMYSYPIVNRETELKFFSAILESADAEFALFLQTHRIEHYDSRNTKDIIAVGLWMLIVEGDAGIGKSRLLAAFVQDAEKHSSMITFSLTMTILLQETLGGLRSLMYQALCLEDLRSTQEMEDHLRKVAGDDTELLTGLCLLNELLNFKFAFHSKYLAADLSTRYHISQHIISTLLRRLWPEKLLLFVIDDAHLMDPRSWDFLFFLTRYPNIIAVCSIRLTASGAPKLDPSVLHIIHRQKNVKKIRLSPMDESCYLPVACQVMEVYALPNELVTLLRQKSKGNPAWIDQVLSELLRTGNLRIVSHDPHGPSKFNLKVTPVNTKYIQKMIVEQRITRRRVDTPKSGWSTDVTSLANSFVSIVRRAGALSAASSKVPLRVQKMDTLPETRLCLVKSDIKLGTSIKIPATLNEFLRDQFDECSNIEQMILKCASILGYRFSRKMVTCLIPQYEINTKLFDIGFQKLMERDIIRCASQPYRHSHRQCDLTDVGETGQVISCHCRFTREQLDDIQQQRSQDEDRNNDGPQSKKRLKYSYCKYMHFTKDTMMETIYEMFMEATKRELHLKAAQYLDKSAIRCRIHGGEDTTYQFGFTTKGSGVGADHEEALRQATGEGRRRTSFYTSIQYQRKEDLASIAAAETSSKQTKTHPEVGKTWQLSRNSSQKKLTIPEKLYDIDILHEMETSGLIVEPAGINFNLWSKCVSWKHNRKKKSMAGHFEEAKEYEFEAPLKFNETGSRLDVLNSDRLINKESTVSFFDLTKSTSQTDLRGCYCTDIQAKVCVEMVKQYRQAQKYGKCLANLLDAGEYTVAVGNSQQALTYLQEAVALVQSIKNQDLPSPSLEDTDDLMIDEEEVNIQVEFLYGLAYFELGIHQRAREYFLKSLQRFGMQFPDEKTKVAARTMKLNSRLWRGHKCKFACQRRRPLDIVDVDPLVTLKLRILTYLHYLYKVERRYDVVLMVSLWLVVTAEEGSGSFQDVLPAYCTMMETYSLTSEHEKATVYEKLALKVVTKILREVKTELPPLGMYTIASVFSTLAQIRLIRGDISESIESAYLSLRIARTMHDNAISMQVYPRLAIALIMSLRVSEVVDILQKLWFTSEEEDDMNGFCLYWTLCLHILLNTAYPVEPFTACENFAANCDWNADVHIFRMYEVQYYTEASIALWYARFNRWEMATKWVDKARKSNPKQINYFTVEAQLKLLECELIFLNNFLETKRYQHFAKSRIVAKQLMTNLNSHTKRVPVLLARLFHLSAYYSQIRSRQSEAENLLKRAEALALSQGNLLEIEWIDHNRSVWAELAIPTIKNFWIEHTESNTLDWHLSTKIAWSNIMYSLPLPAWK